MTAIVLALGSNLGNRDHQLRCAIDRLRAQVRIVRISSFIETDPVGAPRWSPQFLNAAVSGLTQLEPMDLLHFTQQIERDLGRRSKGSNRPRPIDIDIIFYGTLRLRSKQLTIPHPRWKERSFVKVPLAEISRGWTGR